MSTPSLPNNRFSSLGLLLVTPFFIGCAYETSVLKSGWPYSEEAPHNRTSDGFVNEERIMATGYAVIDTQKGQSHPQRRLMAIRASRLDAYRNMAEKVYGVFVESTSQTSEMALVNENIRGRVQGLIYGSKLESITPLGRDSYETVLSLDLELVEELVSRYRLGEQARAVKSSAKIANVEIQNLERFNSRSSRPRWSFTQNRWVKGPRGELGAANSPGE